MKRSGRPGGRAVVFASLGARATTGGKRVDFAGPDGQLLQGLASQASAAKRSSNTMAEKEGFG